ncbi:hypothetical protein IEU95_02480 [Hoyosella rhizosphaerae]|uniref:Uncharacterized protein n=1 Tax=Hoyosella rhizosphaerae TaxID=1755582 RepID=A0A916UDG3_9ACTN|nr:hypothetical protein [Hoyosella rhizosphaerae]MBN4925682.1 hypothetical protein [Hoyosella rhizosphaerae]GGC68733.1 hypothetical protein GCM10011410_21910 [Hoyosella rhizosphaerae]
MMQFRNVAIYVGLVVAAAFGVLIGTAVTIPGGCVITDPCADTQRTIILFVPTGLIFLGVLGAVLFTLQCWRNGDEWRRWFGAVWFLLALVLVVMSMSAGVLTR